MKKRILDKIYGVIRLFTFLILIFLIIPFIEILGIIVGIIESVPYILFCIGLLLFFINKDNIISAYINQKAMAPLFMELVLILGLFIGILNTLLIIYITKNNPRINKYKIASNLFLLYVSMFLILYYFVVWDNICLITILCIIIVKPLLDNIFNMVFNPLFDPVKNKNAKGYIDVLSKNIRREKQK